MLVAGCGALPRPPEPAPYDAGPEPDGAVTADLAARYAASASSLGDQRCRCALDVAYCRASVGADWDDAGRSCLAGAARADVEGFERTTTCLEQAISAFVACHAPLTCGDTTARSDCLAVFEADGSTCYGLLHPVAQAALLACTPMAVDAGP